MTAASNSLAAVFLCKVEKQQNTSFLGMRFDNRNATGDV